MAVSERVENVLVVRTRDGIVHRINPPFTGIDKRSVKQATMQYLQNHHLTLLSPDELRHHGFDGRPARSSLIPVRPLLPRRRR